MPSNFEVSHKRMNSQIRRLSKKPKLLGEYDSVIHNQDQLATIERVGKDELSLSCKMHYIPHLQKRRGLILE